MCGFSGIINLDSRPVDLTIIQKMSETLKHRGPDDRGFIGFSLDNEKIYPLQPYELTSKNKSFSCSIGFNRLSILDLTANGHQPMISYDGKLAIAYNGETYNAFDFKNTLQKKGYRFRSKTDTEVLLYLYQEYGIEKMLELINGMFAFCIVDLNKNKLFLARDHAGIKPLYWYKNKSTILFASEIKAFLDHPDFKSEINLLNIPEYKFYHYCAFDRTLFKGVSRIPQGCYLEITSNNEKLIKYYEAPLSKDRKISQKRAEEILENTLKESIKSQLISDVKVGCQLSGGIDSSLITTFARQYFKANMDTFSIVFDNKQFSEEKYIDQVIEKTVPLAHKFKLTPEYFSENIISAAWHYDEPLLMPQNVGIKRLAQGSSEFVTVLLSGEGSDELMGGYQRFYDLSFRNKNLWYISILSKILNKGKGMIKNYLPELSPTEYFLSLGWTTGPDVYNSYIEENHLQQIFENRKSLIPDHPDLIKNLRYYEIQGWLGATLMIQDKMTMAHSIENRVPFTDKNMFNLIFSLPSVYFIKSKINPFSYSDHSENTKILLKKITEKHYSKDFTYRKKSGFNQPIIDYFQNKKMKDLINDL
ncbi:MAG: asparagine synthase (glutamine-hydrolyzing), partial [Prolixibacteraceae bacterium]|nr:asparagine synthase (glutamine-hydrolyzing) [Prolixibacteraceae bacterium]